MAGVVVSDCLRPFKSKHLQRCEAEVGAGGGRRHGGGGGRVGGGGRGRRQRGSVGAERWRACVAPNHLAQEQNVAGHILTKVKSNKKIRTNKKKKQKKVKVEIK